MAYYHNIVVCDSGFGGLDITRLLLDALYRHGVSEPERGISITYFNAWPHERYGYNHLSSFSDKQLIFSRVLDGIGAFKPDLCIFACNTLSVLYHGSKAYMTLPYQVEDVLFPAADDLAAKLSAHPESLAILTGTETTIASDYYPELLRQRNIAPERIISQSCPYLSTMIEAGPRHREVYDAINHYAVEVKQKMERRGMSVPDSLYLALCCTHYGYSTTIWRQAFEKNFDSEVNIVNPNFLLPYGKYCDEGTYVPRISLNIYSRVRVLPERIVAMSEVFAGGMPMIVDALQNYHYDPGLFTAPDLI